VETLFTIAWNKQAGEEPEFVVVADGPAPVGTQPRNQQLGPPNGEGGYSRLGAEGPTRAANNKAAVAVANKLARIVWTSWYRQRDFEFRAPALVAAT
jgi:hypothetical protein